MIKFRCPACRQKIKADGEQAGGSGRCPHCEVLLTIPVETDREFVIQHEERMKDMERQLIEASDRIRLLEDLQSKTESERRRIEEILKRNLVPQFAGFIEDKMMKKIREDNQQLNTTHEAAQNRIDDFEERLSRAQERIQQKLRAYETRIAELEAELRKTRNGSSPPSLMTVATPATRPASM